MKQLNLKDVSQYVETNIGTFHQKRIQSLDNLKLSTVLKKKNTKPTIFINLHSAILLVLIPIADEGVEER